jgi:streptomycin 6-kinase
MAWHIPDALARSCRISPERQAWIGRLPHVIQTLQSRWSLTLGEPVDGGTCAWVAPAERAGMAVVLKVTLPHMEAEQEADGLRFWNGDPTVRLIEEDTSFGAMLLERCEPGTPLRDRPEPEQDVVIASLLRRMWRVPATPHRFRHLGSMIEHWCEETLAARAHWHDAQIIEKGLTLLRALSTPSRDDVLLATDLHAGNVLRARRGAGETWLAIDPKPFIGDRAYDATQHLFNCERRLASDPIGTIGRIAALLDVDAERVRQWTFARAAAEPRNDWGGETSRIARVLVRVSFDR